MILKSVIDFYRVSTPKSCNYSSSEEIKRRCGFTNGQLFFQQHLAMVCIMYVD